GVRLDVRQVGSQAGAEVVKHAHALALPNQRLDQMRANEPRPSRHQTDVAHASSSPWGNVLASGGAYPPPPTARIKPAARQTIPPSSPLTSELPCPRQQGRSLRSPISFSTEWGPCRAAGRTSSRPAP